MNIWHGINWPTAKAFSPRLGSKEFYLYLLARNWSQTLMHFQTKPLEMTLWLFRIDCKGMKEDSVWIQINAMALGVWLREPFPQRWVKQCLPSLLHCYRWWNHHKRTRFKKYFIYIFLIIINLSMFTLWLNLSNC